MSTQFQPADEQRLFVQSEGNGQDLVLLHGWGMHGGIWDGVAPQLAQRFRLHRIDLPGHGFSSALPLHSLEKLTASIASYVPANSIVCGWSLGGQIALTLARRWPERVRQLVLVATTPCFYPENRLVLGNGGHHFAAFQGKPRPPVSVNTGIAFSPCKSVGEWTRLRF
jgi:pimeloyl-ACP methyl ester carboxylesterase